MGRSHHLDKLQLHLHLPLCGGFKVLKKCKSMLLEAYENAFRDIISLQIFGAPATTQGLSGSTTKAY